MSALTVFMLVLSIVAVAYWVVTIRREIRKEYAVGTQRGQRARSLVLMGASATFWLFVAISAAGVDLSWPR
jgi:hypothetical protein